jgi:hypothetical protein
MRGGLLDNRSYQGDTFQSPLHIRPPGRGRHQRAAFPCRPLRKWSPGTMHSTHTSREQP